MAVLGIDLGGTKIAAILMADGGQVLWRVRRPTPAGDYEATLMAIVSIVSEAAAELGSTDFAIGIGTPGSRSPATDLMRNCNSTCLNDRPFLADLQRCIPHAIAMENDANCFVLSEAYDGAAKYNDNAFGVIVGTGVGGGLIVNGKLLSGANAVGGEWGHNFFALHGLDDSVLQQHQQLAYRDQVFDCYCGRRHCNETHLSGPSLSNIYQALADESCSADVLYQRFVAGESAAQQVLEHYANKLAFALAQVINIVDPEVIVLGGGLSNIDFLYERVPQLWRRYIFSDVVNTLLLKPLHGDDSGVRGAARLASTVCC